MSYCRFSSDDYQCDVYCYASVSGYYVTHVASNRPVLDGTLPPAVPWEKDNADAWLARHEAVMASTCSVVRAVSLLALVKLAV